MHKKEGRKKSHLHLLCKSRIEIVRALVAIVKNCISVTKLRVHIF
jgi:hypothetical protein